MAVIAVSKLLLLVLSCAGLAGVLGAGMDMHAGGLRGNPNALADASSSTSQRGSGLVAAGGNEDMVLDHDSGPQNHLGGDEPAGRSLLHSCHFRSCVPAPPASVLRMNTWVLRPMPWPKMADALSNQAANIIDAPQTLPRTRRGPHVM